MSGNCFQFDYRSSATVILKATKTTGFASSILANPVAGPIRNRATNVVDTKCLRQF